MYTNAEQYHSYIWGSIEAIIWFLGIYLKQIGISFFDIPLESVVVDKCVIIVLLHCGE